MDDNAIGHSCMLMDAMSNVRVCLIDLNGVDGSLGVVCKQQSTEAAVSSEFQNSGRFVPFEEDLDDFSLLQAYVHHPCASTEELDAVDHSQRIIGRSVSKHIL